MKYIPTLLLILCLNQIIAQESGRIDEIYLKSPSVDMNLLGDTTKKKVLVYLPPSYEYSSKRYPVVYFLTGYGSEVDVMFNNGLRINQFLDDATVSGRIKEMIVVVATSKIRLNHLQLEKSPYTWGAFYEDSPVTGNWESFITMELVPYIEATYRTIDKRESRAISGHSMGGSGALCVGLRNPELFGTIYSISSAFIGPNNLEASWMFESESIVEKTLGIIQELSGPDSQLSDYKDVLKDFIEDETRFHGLVPMSLAYGSAFLGDSGLNPPYFEYPYEKADGRIIRNVRIWQKWLKELTDYEPLIEYYKAKNSAIENIVIEFGSEDKNRLTQGNHNLSSLLFNNGIPHEFRYYDGGHGALNERLRHSMFPYLSQHLAAQDTIPDIILEGYEYTVYCIDIAQDNTHLVSGGWDNIVKIWDYKNGEEVRSFDYHVDMIRNICFSKDNSMIASSSRDNTIRITTLADGNVRTIENHYLPNIEDYYRKTYFNSLSFTPDNEQLVYSVAGRKEIFFWDLKSNSLSDIITGPEVGLRGVEISNNGELVAGITSDFSIIIWDRVTKKQISNFRGHEGSVGSLCFSANDKYLVSAGGGNVTYRKPKEYYNLMLWDAVKGELISVLSGHVDVVKDVKFSPDGKYIASVSEDHTVRVWDVSSARQIWKYEGDGYFLSCSISPDGKYLAASSRDASIKLWKLKKITGG